MSAGPDAVARERDSLDPATLESVGRVAITPLSELLDPDPLVVESDNPETSWLDLGRTGADEPARKALR